MEKADRKISLLKQLGKETEKLLDDRCQLIFYQILLSMPNGINVNALFEEVRKAPTTGVISRQSFFNHLNHLTEKGVITREPDLESQLHFKPILLKVREDLWRAMGITEAFSEALALDENLKKILDREPIGNMANNFLWGATRIISNLMIALGEAKTEDTRALIFDYYFYALAIHTDYLYERIKKARIGWDKWAKIVGSTIHRYAKNEKMATDFFTSLLFGWLNNVSFMKDLKAGKLSGEEIKSRLEEVRKPGSGPKPETMKLYEKFKQELALLESRKEEKVKEKVRKKEEVKN